LGVIPKKVGPDFSGETFFVFKEKEKIFEVHEGRSGKFALYILAVF